MAAVVCFTSGVLQFSVSRPPLPQKNIGSSLRPCNRGQLVPGRMLPVLLYMGRTVCVLSLRRLFPYQCDTTSVRPKQNEGSCQPVGFSARAPLLIVAVVLKLVLRNIQVGDRFRKAIKKDKPCL